MPSSDWVTLLSCWSSGYLDHSDIGAGYFGESVIYKKNMILFSIDGWDRNTFTRFLCLVALCGPASLMSIPVFGITILVVGVACGCALRTWLIFSEAVYLGFCFAIAIWSVIEFGSAGYKDAPRFCMTVLSLMNFGLLGLWVISCYGLSTCFLHSFSFPRFYPTGFYLERFFNEADFVDNMCHDSHVDLMGYLVLLLMFLEIGHRCDDFEYMVCLKTPRVFGICSPCFVLAVLDISSSLFFVI
ncbi:hypothetical protein Tco_0553934 [Tanacetum coccineum]